MIMREDMLVHKWLGIQFDKKSTGPYIIVAQIENYLRQSTQSFCSRNELCVASS